jgi:hypothetical protein
MCFNWWLIHLSWPLSFEISEVLDLFVGVLSKQNQTLPPAFYNTISHRRLYFWLVFLWLLAKLCLPVMTSQKFVFSGPFSICFVNKSERHLSSERRPCSESSSSFGWITVLFLLWPVEEKKDTATSTWANPTQVAPRFKQVSTWSRSKPARM